MTHYPSNKRPPRPPGNELYTRELIISLIDILMDAIKDTHGRVWTQMSDLKKQIIDATYSPKPDLEYESGKDE